MVCAMLRPFFKQSAACGPVVHERDSFHVLTPPDPDAAEEGATKLSFFWLKHGALIQQLSNHATLGNR